MALAEMLSDMPQGTPSQVPVANGDEAGRGGDTVLAHLSLGELVIPRSFLDDPAIMQQMQSLFEQAGADINQYIVGDEANSINPETGYPEFGFFKSVKNVFKAVAPLALAYFAPGIGTALGATGVGASALGGAVAGGAGGLLGGGGLKGALTGAALGGAGGYIGGGGLNDTAIGRLGNEAYSSLAGGANDVSNYLGAGNVLDAGGKIFGTSGAGNVLGTTTPVAGGGSSSYGGLSDDGSVLGKNFSLSGTTPGGVGNTALANAGQSAGSNGVSSYRGLSSLLSTGLGLNASNNAQEELLRANQQAIGQIQPFTTANFNPGDLQNDPGYQFRLKQGQEALDARNAATGNYYSGNAQREAGQYASDFAGTEYQNAFQRWLQTQGQQYQAATGLAGLYGNSGDVNANAGIRNSNLLSQGLSGILGGDDNNDALMRLLYGRGSAYGMGA